MNKRDSDFIAIEPYEDWQVKREIESLIEDNKFLLTVSSQLYPKLTKVLPPLAKFIFKRAFSKSFKSSKTIEEFQKNLVPFVERMIDRTTKKFTYSGIENLSSKSTLYVSNHRDIALDSLFLNYVRFLEGYKTVRIAIGNNLLDGGFSEKLMRLNKSFVVHRNIKGIKETYKILQKLSSYIDDSIKVDKESVWIAQKEGRANDGNDFTDTAVLKMLYLACRKKMNLEKWLSRVNLTPISISYEYDPLDITKAIGWEGWEDLSNRENNERDLQELVSGITGDKGRVHLHICKTITNIPKDLEGLAEDIDKEIISNYRLWPSNYIAAKECNLLDQNSSTEKNLADTFFLKRFKDVNPAVLQKALKIYAAPYVNSKETV
ncbi:MAG: 1-acyl-sn-glycerol-3-phosphate acyltransferase [Pseudomonadota bacterium]|nr:1-acyl-sn-glycerol-3-phosphate acyltransferase [Pseudomonadota bacterium]